MKDIRLPCSLLQTQLCLVPLRELDKEPWRDKIFAVSLCHSRGTIENLMDVFELSHNLTGQIFPCIFHCFLRYVHYLLHFQFAV